MAAIADAKGLTHRLGRVRADARLTASMEPVSVRVTPLHVGCASDWKPHEGRMAIQVSVAEILTARGADLHAVATYRGIGEATPLFRACWSSRNLALVLWLLDQGARADVSHLANRRRDRRDRRMPHRGNDDSLHRLI